MGRCAWPCPAAPDSLALTALVRAGLTVEALVVDPSCSPGSAEVASTAAAAAESLGAQARVLTVVVGSDGGLEAAARSARYEALEARAGSPVLLGHTLDDQAETVLLGLARGSGPASLSGMRDGARREVVRCWAAPRRHGAACAQ